MVAVILKEGRTRADADEVARLLNGKVVGYYDYLNLYQIEYHGGCGAYNEKDLCDCLQKACEHSCVELAFPVSQPLLENAITASEISPISNPVYEEANRDSGYLLVRAKSAWDIVRASHLPLSQVRVAVVDDGVYTGFHTFDVGPVLDTSANGSRLLHPITGWEHVGSHGTGIMNIIGAYTDGEGITGIASVPLTGKLTLSMLTNRRPPYGDPVDIPGPSCSETAQGVSQRKI
ncbi:hypothetical protein, partial [Methanoregula sp.]|uniref:hypothetical protein n=1 Tax=Methanoregula sp. TaxID=2052170 RepID=UPI0025D015C0